MKAVVVAVALPIPAGQGEVVVGFHLSGSPARPGKAAGEQRAKPLRCFHSC